MADAIFRKGAKVWVRNPYPDGDDSYRDGWVPARLTARPVWVPAEVLAVASSATSLLSRPTPASDGPLSSPPTAATSALPGLEVTVLTTLVPRLQLTLSAGDVLPMNPVTGIDDMCDFVYLHEAALLFNVLRRFLEERGVTRAGGITLSVNPCRPPLDADGVCSMDVIYMARVRARVPASFTDALPPSRRAALTLPPHIFDVADGALNALMDALLPQAIIVSGEAGAGKTEACKSMLSYLVAVPALESTMGIKPGLMSPVLEAAASEGLPSTARAVLSAHARAAGRPPAILSKPDLAAAAADAARRRGPLGCRDNPFLSQRTWGRTSVRDEGSDSPRAARREYMFIAGAAPPPRAAVVPSSSRSPNREGGPPAGTDAAVALGSSLSKAGRMLLASQVVLDAFTCAATPNNPHSSRAARIIKVYYDGAGSVIGGHITCAALEKRRAAAGALDQRPASAHASTLLASPPHTRGRNFHALYRLVAGASQVLQAQLHLAPLASYALLSTPAYEGDAVMEAHAALGTSQEAEEFALLCDALAEVGLAAEEQAALWRTLAAILALGNIDIRDVTPGAGSTSAESSSGTAPPVGSAVIASSGADVTVAAQLLGIDRAALADMLVKRNRGVVASGSSSVASAASRAITFTFKKGADARAALEALIATLYDRVVACVVAAMNANLRTVAGAAYGTALELAPPHSTEPLFVALVDVLGLEGQLHPSARLPANVSEWAAASGNCDTLLQAYAAEKLHEVFTTAVFKGETAIYDMERIDYAPIVWDDTAPVLALLEDRRAGIIPILDEQSCFPRSTDAAFVTKLLTAHRRTAALLRPAPDGVSSAFHAPVSPAEPAASTPNVEPSASLMFGIRHTGGVLCYSAAGWVASNRDRNDPDLLSLLSTSELPLVRSIVRTTAPEATPGGEQTNLFAVAAALPPLPAPSALAGADASGSSSAAALAAAAAMTGNATHASRYMDEVKRMMEGIGGMPTHFVRCLRPNVSLKPMYVDPALIHSQLVYAGVLHAVALRHAGFTYRTTFMDFYERFVILATGHGARLVYPPPADASLRDLCKELLAQLVAHPVFAGVDIRRAAQFGSTRVFLRRHMIDTLEALREVRMATMDRCCAKIQAVWRGYSVRIAREDMWSGIRLMQAAWRALRARALWLHTRAAAVLIQTAVRRWRVRTRYARMRAASLQLQAWYRRVRARNVWRRLRKGTRELHALTRGFLIRCHVSRMLTAATCIQAAVRRFIVRTRLRHMKDAAAAAFQCTWRGYRFRIDNEDILAYLAMRRAERAKNLSAARIQAGWRGLLTRRRYAYIYAGATVIQRFLRTKLSRATFMRQRRAAVSVQALARGHAAREYSRRVRTLNAIADELWRLSLVREREALELARVRADELAQAVAAAPTILSTTSTLATSSPAARALASRSVPSANRGRGGPAAAAAAAAGTSSSPSGGAAHDGAAFPVTSIMDVDCVMDTSLVYPASWSRGLTLLEKELKAGRTRISTVAVGATHTVVLSEAGHVYTYGFGDHGQAGHGKWSGETKPRLLSALLTDKHLAAAQQEAAPSMILPGTTSQPAGSDVVSLPFVGEQPPLRSVLSPGRNLATAIRVRAIAAGEEHTVALSDAGQVFAWGSNRRGQLGIGSWSSVCVPTQVRLPKDIDERMDVDGKVVEIAAAGYATLALISAGVVFSWGEGTVCGHGVFTGNGDNCTPAHIRALMRSRVRHIAAGHDFAAVVTASGDVFTWGAGAEGQLGVGEDVHKRRVKGAITDAGDGFEYVTGKFKPRFVPTLVDGLTKYDKHSRIVAVACGGRHCVAVSSTGHVYTWGSNTHGQLGMGVIGDVPERVLLEHDAPAPRLPLHTHHRAAQRHGRPYEPGTHQPRPYVASPVYVRALAERHIVACAAGARASYVLSDFNELYAWGCTSVSRQQSAVGDFVHASSSASRRGGKARSRPVPGRSPTTGRSVSPQPQYASPASTKAPIVGGVDMSGPLARVRAMLEDSDDDDDDGAQRDENPRADGAPRDDVLSPARMAASAALGDKLAVTAMLSGLPVELPFHDVPGRTLKRVFATTSTSLSIMGVGYLQVPVAESSLRDLAMTKALAGSRPAAILDVGDDARLRAMPATTAALGMSSSAGSNAALALLAVAITESAADASAVHAATRTVSQHAHIPRMSTISLSSAASVGDASLASLDAPPPRASPAPAASIASPRSGASLAGAQGLVSPRTNMRKQVMESLMTPTSAAKPALARVPSAASQLLSARGGLNTPSALAAARAALLLDGAPASDATSVRAGKHNGAAAGSIGTITTRIPVPVLAAPPLAASTRAVSPTVVRLLQPLLPATAGEAGNAPALMRAAGTARGARLIRYLLSDPRAAAALLTLPPHRLQAMTGAQLEVLAARLGARASGRVSAHASGTSTPTPPSRTAGDTVLDVDALQVQLAAESDARTRLLALHAILAEEDSDVTRAGKTAAAAANGTLLLSGSSTGPRRSTRRGSLNKGAEGAALRASRDKRHVNIPALFSREVQKHQAAVERLRRASAAAQQLATASPAVGRATAAAPLSPGPVRMTQSANHDVIVYESAPDGAVHTALRPMHDYVMSLLRAESDSNAEFAGTPKPAPPPPVTVPASYAASHSGASFSVRSLLYPSGNNSSPPKHGMTTVGSPPPPRSSPGAPLRSTTYPPVSMAIAALTATTVALGAAPPPPPPIAPSPRAAAAMSQPLVSANAIKNATATAGVIDDALGEDLQNRVVLLQKELERMRLRNASLSQASGAGSSASAAAAR